MDGESLPALISGGPLTPRKAIEIATQIAGGLAAAHAAGIVHRDLKPGNIMLHRDGRVRILDFGLAKRSTTSAPGARQTESGMILGTAGYMAPEQVRGQAVDHRADLFSLGVVLYEMLSGKPAFARASSVEAMHAILKDDPPELPASVPPALALIVRRCLEKESVHRFQSASDLAFALQNSLTTLSRMSKPKGQRWRRWAIASGGIAAAFVLVALAWLIARLSPRPSTDLTQTRLTFNSAENPVRRAAISRDGKYLGYSDRAGIHVRLLLTGEERVMPRPAAIPASADWDIASWFPDGTQLLADANEQDGHQSLWAVSLLGQSPRALRAGVKGFDASPDGQRIAFSPLDASGDAREIWVMGNHGDNPRKVFSATAAEKLYSVHWSPDGERFAYIRTQINTETSPTSLETYDLKGTSRTVVVSSPVSLEDFCWLPEGRIVYSQGGRPKQVTVICGKSVSTAILARPPLNRNASHNGLGITSPHLLLVRTESGSCCRRRRNSHKRTWQSLRQVGSA